MGQWMSHMKEEVIEATRRITKFLCFWRYKSSSSSTPPPVTPSDTEELRETENDTSAFSDEAGSIIKKKTAVSRFFDPRSPSDDVERTPISLAESAKAALKTEEVEKEPEAPESDKKESSNSTPQQVKWLQKKMKDLSLDPRSPSGIPRTPILVPQDEEEAAVNEETGEKSEQIENPSTPKSAIAVPKRGQQKNIQLGHKLDFSAVPQEEKKEEETPEITETEKQEKAVEESFSSAGEDSLLIKKSDENKVEIQPKGKKNRNRNRNKNKKANNQQNKQPLKSVENNKEILREQEESPEKQIESAVIENLIEKSVAEGGNQNDSTLLI